MESSYLDRYEIVQTFKENDLQKVFIGTDNQSNQTVVINNIYINDNNSTWGITNQNYKDIFNNILHFEKIDNEIVIVTKTKEGLSLNEYLNNFTPTFTERVNLIYQYLNNIKKYDPLPNNAKSILVDESQIVVNEGKVSFSELIIFNENTFNIDELKSVKNNIVSVLQKLTSTKDIDYKELSLYMKIVGFIDEFRKDNETYNSIEKVLNGFENLNIDGLSMPSNQEDIISPDNTNLVGRRVGSINQDLLRKMDTKKNYPFSIAVGTAGIITTVLVGLFIFKSILPLGKSLDSDTSFSSNRIVNNLTKNKDPKDMVSVNDGKIVEPNSNIDYLSKDIKKDFTNSKYSDFSFKISDGKDNSHKITINQGTIEAHSQLLMWVKSDTPDEFNITVEGYSNENLSLKQSVLYKPLNINNWELVRFTLNKNIDDYVNIVFDNVDGTIWVGKITIDIFK